MTTEQIEAGKTVARVRAGIDVGNATTVAVVVDGDTGALVGETMFPSIKTVQGGVSYRRALNGRKALAKGEHVLTWEIDGEQMATYVGVLAERAVADSARGGEQRYTNGWTLDFILTALASQVDADVIYCDLRTGVPTELYTPELDAAIGTLLRRKFTFTYNTRPVTIIIQNVTVIEEGYGAWLALPDTDRTGWTLIIDGGGGTFNLVSVYEDGTVGNRLTIPQRGVEYVFDGIDTDLVAAGGRKLTFAERRQLQALLVQHRGESVPDDQGYAVTIHNQPRRVDKLARLHLDKAATAFAQTASSKVRMGDFTRVLFVGGAARAGLMGKAVVKAQPAIAVRVADPEFENARGYAGAARRVGKRAR